ISMMGHLQVSARELFTGRSLIWADFRHFHWPPKSPEMNIIEDIRDALLHAVEKRSPPPRPPIDLLTALQDSWCEFPPGYLQTPVESIPRRFASLLRACGGPTR
ncbi:hypothetical protein AVEN_118960-1, partial [Araneus ventricosus]